MSLALLHAGTHDRAFLASWTFDPLIGTSLIAAGALYGIAYRKASERKRHAATPARAAAFYGGLAAIAIALLGPLDTWNDDLFLIHMLQHLTLMIVAAPLLLLGRPLQLALQAAPAHYSATVVGAIFGRKWMRHVAAGLTHPLTVLVLFNLNLALWHLPDFYQLALESDLVHEVEHATFTGTALLFWWVMIDPVPRHHRASAHWRFAMCFATCMFGGLVAAALTVANRVLYPHYLTVDQTWGLSAMQDQQIGGGIMWISGGVYFMLMFAMLYKMVNEHVLDSRTTAPRTRQSDA